MGGHNSKVKSIDVNDKNLIVSGSHNGMITVHNLDVSNPVQPLMKWQSTQSISKTRLSKLKSDIVCYASESGELSLLDINSANTSLNTFEGHSSMITGISFSYIHDALLVSCSLDKQINFWDINDNKVVRNMNIEDPVTAMDFLHNGYYLAYATMYGKICLLDLRSSNKPIVEYWNDSKGKSVN